MKKPWQMLSGKPLAHQRARIGAEIVEETKIKTELACLRARSLT